MFPCIYFDENSDYVNRFYDHLVSVWAERFRKNPNLNLLVKGFVDSLTERDESLAYKRAQAVKELFLMYNPNMEKRILIPNLGSYNPVKAGGVSSGNRKVILRVIPPSFLSDTLNNDNYSGELPYDVRSVLEDNPFLSLFIQVSAETLSNALAVADSIREQIITEYPWIKDQVKLMEGDSNIIYFDGNYLLYRPIDREPYVKSAESTPQDVSYTIDFAEKYHKYVESYRVNVIDEDGTSVRELAEGNQNLESVYSWDIRDDYGNFVLPESSYWLKLELDFGKAEEGFISDPIFISHHNSGIRLKRRVYSGFDSGAVSTFLEPFLEEIADSFISAEGCTLYIQGYSDSTEFEELGDYIARKRADRTAGIIKAFIDIKLDKDISVDNWLRKKGNTIICKSERMVEPLFIYDTGGWRRIIVGEEIPPYRDFIWRRVELKWQK